MERAVLQQKSLWSCCKLMSTTEKLGFFFVSFCCLWFATRPCCMVENANQVGFSVTLSETKPGSQCLAFHNSFFLLLHWNLGALMSKMALWGGKKNLFKLVLYRVVAFSMWEDSHTEEHWWGNHWSVPSICSPPHGVQIKSTKATTLNGSAVVFSQKQTVLKNNLFVVVNTLRRHMTRSIWQSRELRPKSHTLRTVHYTQRTSPYCIYCVVHHDAVGVVPHGATPLLHPLNF